MKTFTKEQLQTIDDMEEIIYGILDDNERKYVSRLLSEWVDELTEKREAAYKDKGFQGQLDRASEEVASWDSKRRGCINYGFNKGEEE